MKNDSVLGYFKQLQNNTDTNENSQIKGSIQNSLNNGLENSDISPLKNVLSP